MLYRLCALGTILFCAVPNASAASITPLKPYHNPIISGFAPDPSCIRVKGQFFCVTSSFSAFPGIPVYTSRDLVQWQQIGVYPSVLIEHWAHLLLFTGNVLSRPEQLPQLALVNQTTGGIWAATIREHKGTFYVTTTLVFDGEPQTNPDRWDNVSGDVSTTLRNGSSNLQLIFTNRDIFAKNGNGWSDPVHFSFVGYDTSLFWDDDGTAYIQGSHAWHIFPAIQQFKIDVNTGKALSEPIILWNGTGGIVSLFRNLITDI